MATTVFPETNDAVTESVWQGLNKSLSHNASWTVTGYDMTDGGGLEVDVAAGEAMVNGYYITSDATEAVVLADASTNYLWLEPDGTLTDNTTGSNPGNALLLGTIVTSGGSISSISSIVSHATGRIVHINKTSDESVATSTTLQDDDDLTVSVEPGVYKIVVMLKVTCGASGGFKYAMATTATNSRLEATSFIATPANIARISSFGTTDALTGALTNSVVMLEGMFALADGGTVKLQWAQNASDATNSTVKSGSHLLIERIS